MKEEFIYFAAVLDENLPVRTDFVGESFCDESFYFSRNSSDIIALEYIISGEGVLNVDGKIYEPEADDVFYLPLKSKHEYYCCKDQEPWRKIFFSFKGTIAQTLMGAYLPQDTHLFKNTGLKENFEKIHRIARNKSYDYEYRNSLISIEIFKILVSLKNSSSMKKLDLADLIKRTLDENLQAPYTVNQLSKDLNYSRNYLIDIFEARFGQTPYQYYKTRKIELAKEYLQTTQFSVTEISEMLCYADSQYFANCFKQYTGMTPTNYRKKTKE